MRPEEFAVKWKTQAHLVGELQGYQVQWGDICRMLDQPAPLSGRLSPEQYTFEKPVRKVGTGESGRADVFMQDRFIVEYKGAGRNLGKAMQQAFLYARELGNPPLIVASDMVNFKVATNFTGSAPRNLSFTLDDIHHGRHFDTFDRELTPIPTLNALFEDPERLHPRWVRERITQQATAQVGQVFQRMVARGEERKVAAHFLMRLIFAMFAEDVGMLRRGLITQVLDRACEYPERSRQYFQDLFTAMQHGGEFWGQDVTHFNGGLFDDQMALTLTRGDAFALADAAHLDWSNVEPAIFGTLFEASMDASTRSKLGAHYTDVRSILRITEPVLMAPLRQEWQAVKAQAEDLARKRGGKEAAIVTITAFMKRLASVKVLDPACGSGNFLVVALNQLMDLEHEVREVVLDLGAPPLKVMPEVHPRQLHGIEVDPFAHELASISTWISYFQSMAARFPHWEEPILRRLSNIENRDALLDQDGKEATWPETEFIVGNPPFLGEKKLRAQLGDAYTTTLWATYAGRVPRSADLVTYWLEKARERIERNPDVRAGFVTTNSIRQPKSRPVLERIAATGAIFDTWPDMPWLQDGAAVRVSLLAFDAGHQSLRLIHTLTGEGTPDERAVVTEVPVIHADLSAGATVTQAARLAANSGKSFQGVKLVGPFDVSGDEARALLNLPNPEGVSNADVVKPYLDGDDITRRSKDRWVIDFAERSREEAGAYVQPFALVEQRVPPTRAGKAAALVSFWRFLRPRGEMRQALSDLKRFIVTSEVAKHRLFVWVPAGTIPSGSLVVLAFEDDFTFGVLGSRVHTTWARMMGQTLEDRPRYTPSTCFETFPFPHPTDEQRAEVEKWARYVVQMREHLLAQDAKATLTGLYNGVEALRTAPDAAHPVGALVTAHDRLDQAVAAAYGWEWPLSEEEILTRLLTLNLERSAHC